MQIGRRDLAVSAVLAAIKNDEDAKAAEAAIAALPIGTFSDEAAQLAAHDSSTMKSFRPLIDKMKRSFRAPKKIGYFPVFGAAEQLAAVACLAAL